MNLRSQFSLRRLFAWIACYAILSALGAGLAMSVPQLIALFATVTAIAFVETWSGVLPKEATFRVIASQSLALYATAMGLGMIAAAIVYIYESPKTLPPWARVRSEGGNFIGDAIANGIAHGIVILVYLFWASLFSTIAFVLSILSARRYRLAFCLVIGNFFGCLVFLWYLAVIVSSHWER